MGHFMRYTTLAVSIVALLGCKKPNGASTSGSAAVTPSGSAGSAVVAGSASAPFDDKLELPNQPARAADEQARVDGVASALRTALTQARAAKTSTDVCKLFDPLDKAVAKLMQINAPDGVDPQVFSSQRSAVFQLFDGASAWCDTPENVTVETLQGLLSDLRGQLVALIGMGASTTAPGKPTADEAMTAAKAWLAAVAANDADKLAAAVDVPYWQSGTALGKSADCRDKLAAASATDLTKIRTCLAADTPLIELIPSASELQEIAPKDLHEALKSYQQAIGDAAPTHRFIQVELEGDYHLVLVIAVHRANGKVAADFVVGELVT